MADFFKGQMDYIFFFYGLAFIILAAICLSFQRRLRPKLAWMWLAAFGAAHGVNEWLDLAALTLGSGPVFDIVRLGVMALSFVFLAEFGRASVVAMGGRSPGRWILAALLGLAALGGFSGLPGLSASARYALGLVGGLWAAGALYLASRVPAPGSRALQGAALGMAGYALAAGLVVNPAPFFPASLFNADFFITAVGFPIQFVRGLLAVWVCGSLWLMAGAFVARGDFRRIRILRRNLARGAAAGLIILLACGWLLTQRLGHDALLEEKTGQVHHGKIIQTMMLNMMEETDRLAAVMASSRWVIASLENRQAQTLQAANEVLDRYIQSFPQSVGYLMDLEGMTIASSNRHRPDSFVDKAYFFRPYFQQALQGSSGRYWALGITSRELGYYASSPVRDSADKIIGVAVIKRPFTGIEAYFPPESLSLVISPQGIVVLANRPDLVLQSLWLLSGKAREELETSRQFGAGPFAPILTQMPVDGEECLLQGKRQMVLRRALLFQGWSVVLLNSMRPILMSRLTGIGATLLFCLVLIGLFTVIGMTIDATAHIQLTEHKYRELYGSLRDGSVAVNLEGTIVEFNPAFQRMLGYSPEDMRRLTYRDITPEKWHPVEAGIIEGQVFERGYSDLYEKEYRRQDGTVFPVELQTYLVRNEEGRPAGMWAFVRDIAVRRQAAEALRESEQKYRLLITNVPAMVYKGYSDWTVDFFDDKVEELTGHPLEDFNARRLKWSELILTEDREGAKEAVIQALKADKSFVREYRILGKSGTVHWIRERGRIICGPEGKIDYISGTFADITKQKAMDEALKQERDFISALLETVGALVVVLDPEGRIVRFNHACELATGYAFDVVKGKHYWDLLLPAAEIESAKTYLQQLRAGNFPSCYESYWVSLDGTRRLINWTNTCLVGEDGVVRHIIGTGIDITRRRQAEAALERLRLQNEMILNAAGEGIFGVDLEGRTTFINPAALEKLGYQAEELLGRLMHELIHYMKNNGSPHPMEDCPLYASLQDGKVRRITDDVFWNKEGKPFPVEYVSTPLIEKGELVGAATVFRDVTEHKQWEGELQAANDRLKLLVSESQERNRNISLINQMNEVFQTCQVSMEAYQAIGHFAPRLFPGEGGALYVLDNSRNLLEAVTVWGQSPPPESMFPPEECWAIRRGRLYALEDAGFGLPCQHISGALVGGYLCVPMAAQGETLGILHVRLHPAGRESEPGEALSPLMEAKQHLALTVSENIALALSNLKLRETLRGQAIRDPLTGLFNRRYLEETLNRELHRIQRLGASLGAVMMDLDHFKEYNDTYGHEGGDAMLSAVGALIRTHCRAEDIPCRYGGEEFLLILPGASLEVTLERAEKLREAVKGLQIHHRDRYINPTSMSLGVAVFPDHGAAGEDLIRAADNALYLAKAQGRNRVVAASVRDSDTV